MGDDPAYGRTLSLQTSRISNRQPNSICSCIAISRITNKPRLHIAASPPTSRTRSTKSLFALLLPLYPIWRIGFNHTYQHLFLKRPAHHHISSVFSIMYHESLGIPRTKPALNLLYSISPLLPYHAKGETGLMGELVIFPGATMVDIIFILLLPHPSLFIKAQNFILQHTRTSFACITIFLKGTHPSGLL